METYTEMFGYLLRYAPINSALTFRYLGVNIINQGGNILRMGEQAVLVLLVLWTFTPRQG
jgi:hypothetical protein